MNGIRVLTLVLSTRTLPPAELYLCVVNSVGVPHCQLCGRTVINVLIAGYEVTLFSVFFSILYRNSFDLF